MLLFPASVPDSNNTNPSPSTQPSPREEQAWSICYIIHHTQFKEDPPASPCSSFSSILRTGRRFRSRRCCCCCCCFRHSCRNAITPTPVTPVEHSLPQLDPTPVLKDRTPQCFLVTIAVVSDLRAGKQQQHPHDCCCSCLLLGTEIATPPVFDLLTRGIRVIGIIISFFFQKILTQLLLWVGAAVNWRKKCDISFFHFFLAFLFLFFSF